MKLFERDELIELLGEIRDFQGSDEKLDRLIEHCMQGVLDPQIMDYIYWSEMTDEEIADKALSYKPITL